MSKSIRQIIVSIGGGHATGVVETGLKIKRSLNDIFPSTNIRVINLDKSDPDKTKQYSYKDYNFSEIHDELSGSGQRRPSIIDTEEADVKDPVEIVLLCGCYALYDEHINHLAQLKIFLDSDGDKRLINLIREKRISTREQLSELLTEYMDHLRLEMQKYIAPTRAHADLIIPSNFDGTAREIIVDGICKVVEALKGSDTPPSLARLSPLLVDFEAERMDVEKERYYDLS
ncbi:DAS2 (YDR020C) [Zygosaccharomyces parabailii]|uniref:ZYBA0S03-08416g1_1 n=1 Tax=Zygosaccharomyces bailii (strain CLIB 213 / ATCC 58445 / CBS 680 / BCRC 21525 / NBRC 1098 / NCYC 1416 / NRRL Y-2227) TaxID=1333698 RepID=A0A8J2T6J0_ZYGB2|nr:DAS2 (YDR020C) [Zygosaccharomyces parabailii]CDF89069.1 ZYBA0S03-08416g1_1 [Zygosaccharomyces bailii CLIB 213]CDH16153.1 related to Putative uridine kinase DAS2 [Zygosaccharomyces bailii ISA1307]